MPSPDDEPFPPVPPLPVPVPVPPVVFEVTVLSFTSTPPPDDEPLVL